MDGKGDGLAASALKVTPPDLTLMSERNGGKFPELQVQQTIKGDAEEPAAHGSRDMPVSGNIFRHIAANQDAGTLRVYYLMKYIEEIQAK